MDWGTCIFSSHHVRFLVKIPDVSEHEWFLTEWSVGADSFNSSASSKHRCANVFLNVCLPMAQLLSKK